MSDVIRVINYAQQCIADIQEDYPDIEQSQSEKDWHAISKRLQELHGYLERKLTKYSYQDNNRRWRIGLALLESAILNLGQAYHRYGRFPDFAGEGWGHVDNVKKRLKDARRNFGRVNSYDNNPHA